MSTAYDPFPYRYSILDPTGNITALVEDPVEIPDQPSVADRLMRLHPEVEQVGFVRFYEGAPDTVRGELRMAGGEFCGNASMSAAALYLLRHQSREEKESGQVLLKVSGAMEAVGIRLSREEDGSFRASLGMPRAAGIAERDFICGGLSGTLPLVEMEGISHIVIEADSVFYGLLAGKDGAEDAVRDWCRALRAEGLGLMFLDENGPEPVMTPLVFIPGSGTLFWEHSCASGSCAAGAYLGWKTGRRIRIALKEPGGILTVENDPGTGKTVLEGHVRICGEHGPERS